ncbi:efflux RND transporter periplasmic adaptor subunit [Silanimonas sp.]|uniref:efflux RND transporter periplasmic adaptor subunit n=1 Tax=Silanimonas sp. TaxID=1929290 RepID=UPI0022CB4713|nr:efflux RND transporter periplasmic adaptor subunit [Silanimonas sp.]MCZ8166400.1 efflux RND transporter periplasmic adaptor subunit [Silanimonas sp.]
MAPTPHAAFAPRPALAGRLALAGALALALAACGGGGGGMQMPPTEVNVAPVVAKSVAQWDEFTGRIEAIESAEIRPRVGGTIVGVHFDEGGLVRKGDLLFTIDDREHRAAVASARADVARADARRALAATELKRSETLIAAKAVSAGELESRQNEAKQADADLLAAQARLETAELNLSFTRVTAPIAGRVGVARMRTGNLVSPGEPVLTTVVSLDPVYVSFQGDERAYLRYQDMAREGSRPSSRNAANPVRVGLANEQGFPHTGRMVFVDNVVDPATGTIFARAELPNPDGVFTPGLFARVQLLGSGQRDALLVHPQAVLTDQDRRYVYVADMVTLPPEMGGTGEPHLGAVRKDVELGPTIDGLVVVEKGLDADDKVVVNGMRKIFYPGAAIVPVEVPMEAPNTVVAAPGAADAAGGATTADDTAEG